MSVCDAVQEEVSGVKGRRSLNNQREKSEARENSVECFRVMEHFVGKRLRVSCNISTTRTEEASARALRRHNRGESMMMKCTCRGAIAARALDSNLGGGHLVGRRRRLHSILVPAGRSSTDGVSLV